VQNWSKMQIPCTAHSSGSLLSAPGPQEPLVVVAFVHDDEEKLRAIQK